VLVQLSTYYYYQTGSSGARIGLVDSSGKATNFNAPLSLFYKHAGTTSNSGSSYDGAGMIFQYDGNGQLSGIPQLCLDPATYLPSDCVTDATDATTNLNDIAIPKDNVLTDLKGNKYYALPRIAYEYFPKTDDSKCSALDLTGLPATAVKANLYKDPSNKNQALPTDAELEAKYLQGGKLVVIKGIAQFEAN